MRWAVAVALCVAGLAGCARRMPPMATAADARRANVELAALEQGRTLLVRKCGGCHRPPMPTEHAPEVWPIKLDEMAARANLDPGQRHAIHQYLVTMAAAAR